MSDFRHSVLAFVKKIPKGKVVSYGQVAAACGHPRAARQVGGILKAVDISETFNKPSRAPIHSGRGIPRKGRSEASRKGKPLSGFPSDLIPWWRVVNNHGIISIKGNWTATKELQKDLLVADGVEVKDFKIQMQKYRWKQK